MIESKLNEAPYLDNQIRGLISKIRLVFYLQYKKRNLNFAVLFQAMIFETAFQNLVVLIYVVKTDLFCFMRSAFLLYITLISCHNYLNI